MTKSFANGMTKATELTRSGRLQEATKLIQSLLGAAATTPAHTDDQAIEGEFARLDGSAPDLAVPEAPYLRPKSAKPSRSGLAETLHRVAAGGMPGPAPKPHASLAVAAGARFLTLTHASKDGSRDYRLYVPATRTEASMPLIVMLHGCTQTPEDFAMGTGMNDLAEEFGCLIAYPAQPSGANMQKCWNWFRPEDQTRGCGEPALIAGLTRDILRHHPADPERVYITGLSAGGAAAAIVGAAYPDLFAAVGVHSGLPAGAARDVPSAFAAMRSGATGRAHPSPLPTIVFHGLADSTVHPANGTAVMSQAAGARTGLKASTLRGTSAGGRAYRRTKHAAPDGRVMVEHWEITGAGHAWAGGRSVGSYTDPEGPDASREMLQFFLQHAKG
jgi:poly(hydroxyalkanoate) depolymerase family esterase